MFDKLNHSMMPENKCCDSPIRFKNAVHDTFQIYRKTRKQINKKQIDK